MGIFRKQSVAIKNAGAIDNIERKKDLIKIAFTIGGGFGDNLIFANYLYNLRRKYNNNNTMVMDVFFSRGYSLASSIFEENGVCCDHYGIDDNGSWSHNYDVVIWVNRYPKVFKNNSEKIKRINPDFACYIDRVLKFEEDNSKYFEYSPYLDGLTARLCIIKGQNRLQQADFDSSLGLSRRFDYKVFVHEDEDGYLNNVGLNKQNYITLHRGSDVTYSKDGVKLWSLDYYNNLIEMLHKEYPEYKLVQIGVNEDRCPTMKNIDLNLVGKTTMEQVKVLLKNTRLHVDGEGGFIHLQQSLQLGKSVVLFGATSEAFFGYDSNINIVGTGCIGGCEWVTSNWTDKCAKGLDIPACMTSIFPEKVMSEIRLELGGKEGLDE